MKGDIRIIDKDRILADYVESSTVDMVYTIIRDTYFDKEVIHLENPTDADGDELGEFLTYVLAYPIGVKTPKVIIEGIGESHSKEVLIYEGHPIVCFSGGIDSTAALIQLIEEGKEPIALWCDYGQPYNEPERTAVEQICHKLNRPLIEVVFDISDLIELGTDRFGHVFPARNLLIGVLCLCFEPSEIILAGLQDELSVPDKSLRMYEEFGRLFGTRLSSPFVELTKTDVLRIWRNKWKSVLDAHETVSCYGANGNCQNCSSCAKRELALIGSGYSTVFPQVFINQHELIEKHWFSRIDNFQFKRRTDILIGLLKVKDKLTEELQDLVDIYSSKYKEEIEIREKLLESLS